MRRVGSALLAAGLALLVAGPAFADPFPITQLDGSTPLDEEAWTLPQAAPGDTQNAATISPNVLRLTTTTPGFQVGNATIVDSFRSDVAFTMDFDYAAYGGGNPGDAMTFFLMDAAQAPNLGQSGGAAGYVSMQGAYVAVGLDSAGNFGADNVFPNQPNTVTLRGAAAATPDSWPVLADVPAPGGTVAAPVDARRHVQVVVEPSPTGRVYLTVRMNAAAGGPLTTVYDRVDIGTLGRGQPVRPERFALGFTAGTGGATNTYEVSAVVAAADVDLSVTKTAPAVVSVGDQVQWTVVAANDATNPVEGARVRDTLPPGVTDATWTCASAAAGACPDPPSGVAVGGVVDVPVDLLRDESVTLTITGTVPGTAAATTLDNTAEITADTRTELTPGDNTAESSTRVRAQPDLTPTVSVPGGSLLYGLDATWTVTVDNLAADDGEAPDAAVSVAVPPTVDRAGVVAPAGCAPTADGFLCDLGLLPAGGASTLTFTGPVTGDLDACVAGPSTFAAVTSTTAADVDPANDADAAEVACTVPVDLSLTKTAPTGLSVGDQIVYTVTASNAGTVVAPGTAVSDDLPAGLAGATWTCTVSDGSACAPATGAGDVATVASIPAGGSLTVVVTARADVPGVVTNTAVVTPCSACTSADPSDDTASATTTVRAAPTPSPVPSPAPTTPSGGQDRRLATTGADSRAAVVWSALLVLVGAAATVGARPRRR